MVNMSSRNEIMSQRMPACLHLDTTHACTHLDTSFTCMHLGTSHACLHLGMSHACMHLDTSHACMHPSNFRAWPRTHARTKDTSLNNSLLPLFLSFTAASQECAAAPAKMTLMVAGEVGAAAGGGGIAAVSDGR